MLTKHKQDNHRTFFVKTENENSTNISFNISKPLTE